MIYTMSRGKRFTTRDRETGRLKNIFDSDVWIIWKRVPGNDVTLWKPIKEFMDDPVGAAAELERLAR